MQLRTVFAALLASTMITPAFAQEADVGVERMERGDIGRSTIQDRDRMRAPPERFERGQPEVRAEPQQRVERQFEPRQVEQRQVEQRQVEQRQAPVVIAAPAAPGTENRGWRGDWQRRVNEVEAARAQTPPTIGQAPADQDRGWRENNGGRWNRGDRDGDGRPNWRDRDGDRDGDGDGIRNNRDWDRNNNGRVDDRWDWNRNGVVDRRWDHNRDGVRDNRDGRNWNRDGRWNNNNQHWGDQNWNNNHHWNREWRNDRRYDWQRYRYSNRDLYRQPRYYSPYGYGQSYQRFGIGIYLESILFGSRYRISDPWRYRLPDAQWPYEWVRYHDDVLLVDTRSGYVVDVIYSFFW